MGLPIESELTTGDTNRRPFLWDLKSRKRSTYSKGGSKRKKLPTWTHTFVCLAKTNMETVPDSQERSCLLLAGLGEKKVQFGDYCEWEEIYDELLFQYPKLKEGGGFELLRVGEGGGKRLQVIACPPNGYTVAYLRAVVHHATVYIRPLQRDLSVEVDSSQAVSAFHVPNNNILTLYAYRSIVNLFCAVKDNGHFA